MFSVLGCLLQWLSGVPPPNFEQGHLVTRDRATVFLCRLANFYRALLCGKSEQKPASSAVCVQLSAAIGWQQDGSFTPATYECMGWILKLAVCVIIIRPCVTKPMHNSNHTGSSVIISGVCRCIWSAPAQARFRASAAKAYGEWQLWSWWEQFET
jgi:hypothetical protein